ncbi:hypothetical protein BT96DRAFT_1017209 [Gymnopus androsaceus JB14]|uniref:Uncharacterized protein n=1 Tax=Gymnopus androsaceus JB14 TaxID=1447944 RepID=A0A6A4I2N8_9AGAR|nr:hypothetical protein BT96DRAFT_1017209 [Gymnopus androsaceus JB14]
MERFLEGSKGSDAGNFKKLGTIFEEVIAVAKNLDESLNKTFELFVEPNTSMRHLHGGKSRIHKRKGWIGDHTACPSSPLPRILVSYCSGRDPSTNVSRVDPISHQRNYKITIGMKRGEETYTTVSVMFR